MRGQAGVGTQTGDLKTALIVFLGLGVGPMNKIRGRVSHINPSALYLIRSAHCRTRRSHSGAA